MNVIERENRYGSWPVCLGGCEERGERGERAVRSECEHRANNFVDRSRDYEVASD